MCKILNGFKILFFFPVGNTFFPILCNSEFFSIHWRVGKLTILKSPWLHILLNSEESFSGVLGFFGDFFGLFWDFQEIGIFQIPLISYFVKFWGESFSMFAGKRGHNFWLNCQFSRKRNVHIYITILCQFKLTKKLQTFDECVWRLHFIPYLVSLSFILSKNNVQRQKNVSFISFHGAIWSRSSEISLKQAKIYIPEITKRH